MTRRKMPDKILKNQQRASKPLGNRQNCYRCHRPKSQCLCDMTKAFNTNIHFVILMHPKEAKKIKLGTGRLANLCLKNSKLFIGDDFTKHDEINELLGNKEFYPMVLYPHKEAKIMGDIKEIKKKLLVFVIDGTWHCASRILVLSPNINSLSKLSFSGSYKSKFTIKKQPKDFCVSTIEAIYYLLAEGEAAGIENTKNKKELLMNIFDEMVKKQLEFMVTRAGFKPK